MSPFSRHISYARLLDYAERRLPSAELDDVQAHLATCWHCARQRELLAKMMRLMGGDQARGTSPETFQLVKNLINTRLPVTGKAQSPIRKIVAVLRSELAPFTPVFGERSGPSAARQLFYQAGTNAVELQIVPRKEGLLIAGQLLGPCERGEVELTNGEDSWPAPLHESAEFTFFPVAEGSYKLWIRWSGVEVEVPEFKL